MSVYLRALFLFLVLAGLSLLAWQLALTPGAVALEWHGWRVDTSVGVLLVLVLAIFVLGALLYSLWRGGIGLPRRLRERRAWRRREAGFEALNRGMVAIFAGDPAEARRHARIAGEMLDRPSGALLIGAQAAQLEGRTDLARQYYEAMTQDRGTELLGLRGLLAIAEQAGDCDRALALAERARVLAPRSPWVLTRLFHLEIAARRWEAAERTLRAAMAAKAIGQEAGRRSDAVLMIQLSLMAERNGNRVLALERARRALSLDPGLLPASLQLASLHHAEGQNRRARKVIEAAWARQPHPDLARLYTASGEDADPVKRYQAIERLAAIKPGESEGRRALARAALDAKLWGEARRHLVNGSGAPDAAFCRLLAELEQNERGDPAMARDWLGAASAAEPEPAWLCRQCGAQAREWSALCGHCGGFDTMEWGRPPRVAALAGAPSGTVLAGSEVREQRPEIRDQRTEIRDQRSETRDQG